MNLRQRLQTVLAGRIPDCVPVAPDTSNMIPCRLTGKPLSWQIYLYQDPPVWKAYIDAVKHFGFDSLMDGYFRLEFPEEIDPHAVPTREYIVERTDEAILTQRRTEDGGKQEWHDWITVYSRGNPPASGPTEKLHRPRVPERFEPVDGVRQWPKGVELARLVKKEMGDHGLVGAWCGSTVMVHSPETILEYYDNPGLYQERTRQRLADVEMRFRRIMAMPADARPDFICCGGSGTLVFQTPDMFREMGLPVVQKVTALCKQAGIPSHIHSCGPEKLLVQICADETDLTVIDPLEIPPMGDCDLADLKRRFGGRLVLKGNLHTTQVMLMGSADDVRAASRQAIDDAAAGGRFILSTGDQCGRDTPDANLRAMIATAREYGKY